MDLEAFKQEPLKPQLRKMMYFTLTHYLKAQIQIFAINMKMVEGKL